MGQPFDMPAYWLAVWWGLWVGQALWCWYNANLFARRLCKQQTPEGAADRDRYEPTAVVIVPVKGAGDRLEEHVAAMAGQAYPRYRLVYVVESKGDPAVAVIERAMASSGGASGGPAWQIVEAGVSVDEGQKVHNLRRGLAAATAGGPTDGDGGGSAEVLVFADADAVPGPAWLGRMVFPLRREGTGATTGYRWMAPTDDRLASRVVSVMNGSVATLLGPDRRNHAWGGSMAIRRSLADEIDLDGYWRGALSDDFQMTRAIRESGKRLYFVLRNLLPSPVSMSWGGLLEFGRRQYMITRVHAPWVWLTGLLATGGYTGAWLSAVVFVAAGVGGGAGGWGWAAGAGAVVAFADAQRGRCRAKAVRAVMPEEVMARLGPALRLDRWATPMVMAVHFFVVLSSAFGRTLDWAGVRYRLRGRQRVEVVGRRRSR